MTENETPVASVILLAGSNRCGPSRSSHGDSLIGPPGTSCKALIPLHDGRTCIDCVLDALRESHSVATVVVVGETALAEAAQQAGAQLVEQGVSVVENLFIGFSSLGWPRQCLICTCDVPLLTPASVDFIVRAGTEVNADVVYPIISREVSEAAFPRARRTYATLTDGTFTGGNLMLLNGEFVRRSKSTIQSVFAARKSPIKLCRMLGLRFILRFLMKKLSVAEVERRVCSLLNCTGRALVCPFPEVGFDVDQPEDLEAVSEFMQRPSRQPG
ncbi:MAG: hypothetical protein AUJ92_21670 [Armatimonadetes bacterium CG2_30_59_28]|nr:NTP transferase domain-containing protein [Armatimonadota bacterium]OIO89341.1 MAG: hypothetical protein AUJ92_21670 [Armatimonadetes bacterium CG2_30_59_28]